MIIGIIVMSSHELRYEGEQDLKMIFIGGKYRVRLFHTIFTVSS